MAASEGVDLEFCIVEKIRIKNNETALSDLIGTY